MVYKKYTYKKGKVYGPYLYENKRVGEKIITTYLGREKENKKKNYLFFIFAGVLLLTILLILASYLGSPTGKATLEIQESYNAGEQISGSLNLHLKAGELIPADSKVLVNFDNEKKEFLLSELVGETKVQGSYYVEGAEIGGNGEGYGNEGITESYPEINFELLVSESIEEISQEAGNVSQPEIGITTEQNKTGGEETGVGGAEIGGGATEEQSAEETAPPQTEEQASGEQQAQQPEQGMQENIGRRKNNHQRQSKKGLQIPSGYL